MSAISQISRNYLSLKDFLNNIHNISDIFTLQFINRLVGISSSLGPLFSSSGIFPIFQIEEWNIRNISYLLEFRVITCISSCITSINALSSNKHCIFNFQWIGSVCFFLYIFNKLQNCLGKEQINDSIWMR